MNATIAMIAASVLFASNDTGPSETKSVPLAPWDSGHSRPTGNVYYQLSVFDDGTNSVQLELHIINNTGHDVAIHKSDSDSDFFITLLDTRGRAISARRGSGRFTTGPQEYLVFGSAVVHPDGDYCQCCVLRKRSEIDRAAFKACSRVEVRDSLLGFLDDMRQPVRFEINTTFDQKNSNIKKGQPTSGSSEPSQSSVR